MDETRVEHRHAPEDLFRVFRRANCNVGVLFKCGCTATYTAQGKALTGGGAIPDMPQDMLLAKLTRPTAPGEDKVEAVAKAVRRARFERNGKGKAYDPELPLHETELLDARAAITAMGHTPPSGEDGELVRDLHRHAFDDCGCIPPRTHIAVQAADRLTAILSDVGVLREALAYIAGLTEREDISDGGKVVFVAAKASTALQGIGER
jgi:hypothetical protein